MGTARLLPQHAFDVHDVSGAVRVPIRQHGDELLRGLYEANEAPPELLRLKKTIGLQWLNGPITAVADVEPQSLRACCSGKPGWASF